MVATGPVLGDAEGGVEPLVRTLEEGGLFSCTVDSGQPHCAVPTTVEGPFQGHAVPVAQVSAHSLNGENTRFRPKVTVSNHKSL